MQLDGGHFVIDLQHRELLSLRLEQPAWVLCLDGVLWVTQQREAQDRVLTPGLSLGARADNDIVIQALGASRLSVRALPLDAAGDPRRRSSPRDAAPIY